MDIHEAGGIEFVSVADRRADALVMCTAALVAGGGGAHAQPYTTISKTLSKDFLTVLGDMRSGFPSSWTIRETVIPEMLERLMAHNIELLKDMDFNVHVDGGAGYICNGIKILAWFATSPLLPYDLLVHIDLLPVHETGEIQADLLVKLAAKLKVSPKRIRYLGVDNCELNILTAKFLNEMGIGFNTLWLAA